MGHKQSSLSPRKRRLKSVGSNSNKNGEITEVVEFEFSDASIVLHNEDNFEETSKRRESTTKQIEQRKEAYPPELLTIQEHVIVYPPELLRIQEHVVNLKGTIENMSEADIDLYFATLKDDLHNYWSKVYSIKETDPQIGAKKHEVIDNIRALLKRLNQRFLEKSLGDA